MRKPEPETIKSGPRRQKSPLNSDFAPGDACDKVTDEIRAEFGTVPNEDEINQMGVAIYGETAFDYSCHLGVVIMVHRFGALRAWQCAMRTLLNPKLKVE